MPTRTQLRERRSVLVQHWHDHLGGPMPDLAADAELPESLLESWRRSALCVRPDVAAAPVDDPDDVVGAWRDSGLGTGLDTVEGEVHRIVDDGDLVAAVTDPRGRIVWTAGSRVMRAKAERVNFVPGGCWDESSVGTNALALALRTGRPATVYSAEHFSAAVHDWVCYSVPLRDPSSGEVLGVVDLSTTWDRAHPLLLGTVAVVGRLMTAGLSRPARTETRLDLKVLGGWQVTMGGRPLMLPHRQVEILLLLALHPDGLSLESLHARLYGDAPVGTATLKAEVSHLRAAIGGGVGSRPYRLTMPVDSDVQRAMRSLDAGQLRTAVSAAAGPLLPGSEAPDVLEWRAYIEVALRNAVLAGADAPSALQLADACPYDEALAAHALELLPAHDPRRAAAAARVHRAQQ